MGRTIRNSIRRICCDQRGVSAIEFAFIAPIMVTLLLGAYDFGNAAQRQIALQEAVRTGGQYAVHFPTNPTAVQAAVTSALPNGWALTNPGGVPVVTCSCTGVAAPFDCSAPPSTCTLPANGGSMRVSITATMAYTALTPLFAAAIPNNTATYVARFQ